MTEYEVRRLAAAVILRAAQDVRGESLLTNARRDWLRDRALTWLESPEAAQLAEGLDVRIPNGWERRRPGHQKQSDRP